MMFFEEGRVCKSANGNCIFGKFITYVRSTETVSNAGKFGVATTITFFDYFYPLRHSFISKCGVLDLPGLIVEVRITVIMPIFAMLPDRVLVPRKHIKSILGVKIPTPQK
jgi:hypothetical protein